MMNEKNQFGCLYFNHSLNFTFEKNGCFFFFFLVSVSISVLFVFPDLQLSVLPLEVPLPSFFLYPWLSLDA